LYSSVRWPFEALLAVGILILLSPLLMVIALLIKATSKGPVFYSQVRVGYGGKVFVMLKFRTMRIDAEQRTGPVWATDGDSRCTWIGAYLRRWSLDELPQLVNVIRGEMSLVGPRPERPFFVSQFAQNMPHYHLRHAVVPGITGWAQVHGWRGNTSVEARLEHDLYYVRHQSLRLDLMVLALTPYALLAPIRLNRKNTTRDVNYGRYSFHETCLGSRLVDRTSRRGKMPGSTLPPLPISSSVDSAAS
jgi:putative colanic acid biosynthesis UDP-glucose lipid carrier transferase